MIPLFASRNTSRRDRIYSLLMTSTGETRVARRAGMNDAASAVVISAVAPAFPEEGERRQTTVASTNGSSRADIAAASARMSGFTPSCPRPDYASVRAAWIASQTFADVSGMSMFFTPRGWSASITAFT